MLKRDISHIREIHEAKNYPVPIGLTDNDVQLEAPRLYTDSFYLFYLKEMARVGMVNHGTSLNSVTRKDVMDFFTQSLSSFTEIQNKASNVLLNIVKLPYIPTPKKVDFVKEESILTGWLGNRRPLNTIEITQLYLNILRNIHG